MKCQECIHFHAQEKFTPKGPIDAWYAWCSKKSVYSSAPSSLIPPEAAQLTDEPISKPFLVRGNQILVSCTDAVHR
jgi:hypothetical protein